MARIDIEVGDVGDASALDGGPHANQLFAKQRDHHMASRKHVADIGIIEMLLIVCVQHRHDRVDVDQRRRANFPPLHTRSTALRRMGT